MPPITVILQVVLGLGLLNVWLVRARSATAYRGGQALSHKEEFATYSLPDGVFYAVGALKIGAGVCLLASVAYPPLVVPAASVVVVLMLGALAMHARVHDPLVKSLPALAMMLMSSSLLILILR